MKAHAAVCLILAHISCASITAPATDRLRVRASVPTATVSINHDNRGLAPVTLEVPKGRRSHVVVGAPGYRPVTCNTRMSPGVGYIVADVALCVLLFPIGCISFIDAGGAWDELEAPTCAVDLQPNASNP